MVIVGSKRESKSSPTVPSQESREANSSGGVVTRSIHQFGCIAPSAIVLRDSCGGIAKPLRVSRCRAPATGTSTVSCSASKPAALARAMRSSPRDRSRHTYNWNHLRAPGAAAATSSIEVVPIVDRA